MKPSYTLTLLLVLVSIALCAQDRDFYPPTIVPDRIMLNLTSTPSERMAVNWRTALYVKQGYVQVAEASPSPDLLDSVRAFTAVRTTYTTDQNAANYFSAVMDSLRPDTKYAYRVGDSTTWSEWAHFETADTAAAPMSFIYFGDAQNNVKSLWSRTIRGAYSQLPKADFLLHAGDLINSRNRDQEWGEWFYAGGWIYGTMPSIATPGNHEYYNNKNGIYTLTEHWKPSFTLPENGPEGYEETVYYIDYQDVRIISLNSPMFDESPEHTATQVKWLKQVLKDNDQKWTIVTMHHPVYSTAVGRNNEILQKKLRPIFENYKVDLVLQGHDHTYGRGTNLPMGKSGKNSIDGPIYVVSVSGPKMYPHGLDKWIQKGASNTQLYQLIRVDGDLLRFEAYTVDDQLYDAFELRKQQEGSNLFTDLASEGIAERLELPKRYLNHLSEEELEAYRTRFEAYKERKEKMERRKNKNMDQMLKKHKDE